MVNNYFQVLRSYTFGLSLLHMKRLMWNKEALLHTIILKKYEECCKKILYQSLSNQFNLSLEFHCDYLWSCSCTIRLKVLIMILYPLIIESKWNSKSFPMNQIVRVCSLAYKWWQILEEHTFNFLSLCKNFVHLEGSQIKIDRSQIQCKQER